MQMEIEAAGDRLTARIKGELDHHSAAQARAQLDALLTDERIRELRIDLRGLTFMDSSGLGVILGRYGPCRQPSRLDLGQRLPGTGLVAQLCRAGDDRIDNRRQCQRHLCRPLRQPRRR